MKGPKIMSSYESPAALALRAYADTHPEKVVWSPETGWADEDEAGRDA